MAVLENLHSPKLISFHVTSEVVQKYSEFFTLGGTQCENFKILLSLRFYVKSILEIVVHELLLFCNFHTVLRGPHFYKTSATGIFFLDLKGLKKDRKKYVLGRASLFCL